MPPWALTRAAMSCAEHDEMRWRVVGSGSKAATFFTNFHVLKISHYLTSPIHYLVEM